MVGVVKKIGGSGSKSGPQFINPASAGFFICIILSLNNIILANTKTTAC